MTWRILASFFGSLILAVGVGLAWALLFPSTRTNNILFGGMLIPLVWVFGLPWLWFSSWTQLWLKLVPAALVLYGAVYWSYRFG